MSLSDSELNRSKDKFEKRLHVNFKASHKYPALSRRKMLVMRRHCKELREMQMLSAAALNNVDGVKAQLKIGVSPNCADEHGRTALHIAAAKGYTEVVRLLLSRGADPNQCDKLSNTPLHLAACTHNLAIILLLIEAGADVSRLDLYGKSPLELAQSKLQLLQRYWREGSIELLPMRAELQLIIDIMISVSERTPTASLGALKSMKESLNTAGVDNVDDQVTRLLVELEGIKISENM